MHIPHRMVAPADGLDEFHAIGHRNGLREALDDIGRTHASDKRHRPVSVPPRLFAVRDARHVRDAPKTDCFGGLHARFEQPDRVIADFHGASERRQVHENQTVFDRDGVRSAIRIRNERAGVLPLQLACLGYGKLFRHPTAVRRGVSGFRVAQHLHLPITHDKQAETAGRERDDAHVGERTERFWDGLNRRRVVLLSTAGELDVAVDRDDASDATQSEAVVRIRRLPSLGYGKLFSWDRIAE